MSLSVFLTNGCHDEVQPTRGGPVPRQVAKKADEQAKKSCTSMVTASVPASRFQVSSLSSYPDFFE